MLFVCWESPEQLPAWGLGRNLLRRLSLHDLCSCYTYSLSMLSIPALVLSTGIISGNNKDKIFILLEKFKIYIFKPKHINSYSRNRKQICFPKLLIKMEILYFHQRVAISTYTQFSIFNRTVSCKRKNYLKCLTTLTPAAVCCPLVVVIKKTKWENCRNNHKWEHYTTWNKITLA